MVCILADSSQLQRSLFMLADYAGINAPCFLLLNMADVAADQGKKIDAKAIEEKLGIPVIPFSATDVKSYDEFYKTLEKALKKDSRLDVSKLKEQYESIKGYQEKRQPFVPNHTLSAGWDKRTAPLSHHVSVHVLGDLLGYSDSCHNGFSTGNDVT